MTLPSEINLYISIPLLFHHPNSYQKEKGNFSTQRGINVLLTIPLTDSQHSLFLFASGGKEKGGEKGMLEALELYVTAIESLVSHSWNKTDT